MLSFTTEEREALLDQRWLELLISVLGGRMGHLVTGRSGLDILKFQKSKIKKSHLKLLNFPHKRDKISVEPISSQFSRKISV